MSVRKGNKREKHLIDRLAVRIAGKLDGERGKYELLPVEIWASVKGMSHDTLFRYISSIADKEVPIDELARTSRHLCHKCDMGYQNECGESHAQPHPRMSPADIMRIIVYLEVKEVAMKIFDGGGVRKSRSR